MTAEERAERGRESDRKYNRSAKGRARYERAHPERAVTRWEPARNAGSAYARRG